METELTACPSARITVVGRGKVERGGDSQPSPPRKKKREEESCSPHLEEEVALHFATLLLPSPLLPTLALPVTVVRLILRPLPPKLQRKEEQELNLYKKEGRRS